MSVYLARQALQHYKHQVLDPVLKIMAQPPTSALDAIYLKEIQDFVMAIEGHRQPSYDLQMEILSDALRFFGERRFNTQLSAHERWLSWLYYKSLRSARAGVLVV
jgi:hypothetical protein